MKIFSIQEQNGLSAFDAFLYRISDKLAKIAIQNFERLKNNVTLAQFTIDEVRILNARIRAEMTIAEVKSQNPRD